MYASTARGEWLPRSEQMVGKPSLTRLGKSSPSLAKWEDQSINHDIALQFAKSEEHFPENRF